VVLDIGINSVKIASYDSEVLQKICTDNYELGDLIMKSNLEQGRARRDRELFDAIALKYAKKDIYPPSRRARALRFVQTLNKLHLNNQSDILEVGCGAGFASEYLRGRYRNYTGLDYSQELILSAQQRNRFSNASFQAADFFDYQTDNLYDVIFMIGVLHHMTNLTAALEKCLDLLKPGGVLVVNEPQDANPFFQYLRQVRTKIDKSYSAEQDQLDESELLELFSTSGFLKTRSYPQGFFSTPFAEVMLPPQWLMNPISHTVCLVDQLLEKYPSGFMKKMAWNIVVCGQKPF
jgi:2-polyprenyl-3-methyl-5-hydroxy-6-metoxy-1,4-benzoquinol methylase